jgi:co-chaperonin GroES (HSP10)
MTMSIREQQTGKFYGIKSKSGLILPSNELEEQIEQNKLEAEIEQAKVIYLEAAKAKQKELEERLSKIELMPLGNNVILLPYPENPYRKMLHGSIIVDYTGTFDNPDSGEKDTYAKLISCAKIIEVGPEVEHLKVGDDVFVTDPTLLPLPFFGSGYKVASERNVIAVINEGLKARFGM